MSTLESDGYLKETFLYYKQRIVEFSSEIRYECIPIDIRSSINQFATLLYDSIHVPFLPMFHRPGWLLRYIVGPYDKSWAQDLSTDFLSGITVGLILIPQGLAYGVLAGVPAINGLYSAIAPAFIYAFFGSSMQLGVGPVAIVSLLTSQIVNKYETGESSTEVLDITAEICVSVGLILTILGLLNMGFLVDLISHSVMSGFTTAAAFTIGLSQLPNAVGIQSGTSFQKVPKTGEAGYDYNYQVMAWYVKVWHQTLDDDDLYGNLNPSSPTYEQSLQTQQTEAQYMIGWSRFNPFSQRIFAGVYIPLMIFQLFKNSLVETTERKNAYWYRFFILATPLFPFLVIILAGKWTEKLMQSPLLVPYNVTDTTYLGYMQNHISIVGTVSTPDSGALDFGRTPTMIEPFGPILVDAIPLTFVLFMESYAVARRIANQRNELHILNPSQEMFALGIGNFFGALTSGFPIAGSFSRSSLFNNLGAKSAFALIISMIVLLVAIGVLESTFYYIPQAALSAIIYVALYGVISLTEFWEAWKNNKKEFLVMFTTFIFVFVFNTTIGLPIGIACSILVYLYDLKFAKARAPYVYKSQKDNDGVDIIRVNSELTFVTIDKLKQLVNILTEKEVVAPSDSAIWQEKLIFNISRKFDDTLIKMTPSIIELPTAVVIDLSVCSFVDLTSVHRLAELGFGLKLKRVAFILINANDVVSRSLRKFGYVNTPRSNANLEIYLQQAANIDIEWIQDSEDASNYNDDGPSLESVSRIEYNDKPTKTWWSLGFITKDAKEVSSNGSLMLSSTNAISSSTSPLLN